MMKKLILKNGQTLYVSETAVNKEYTAEKLAILTEFINKKPLMKATVEEIQYLMKSIFGKDIVAGKCKACTRNRYITLLSNYKDLAAKLLQVKDETAIQEYEAEVEKTEDTEPVEKPKKPANKSGKGGKK